MRLVFAGTPQTAVPSLTALLGSRHEVAAVVTRPDARAGRGRRMGPSPVARHAAEAGLEILKPASPRDPDFLGRLAVIAPDCCPVTAYGGLIPRAALEIPPRGWVNLHFSVLPAWRGAAPVPRAILHGDDITGATTFRLVAALDEGPVYGVVTEPIRPDDTAGDLLERLAESGAGLLVATLDGIEAGQLEARPQPASGVSYAPKLTPEDARVRWDMPAHVVGRQIRACTPSPGAWGMLGQTRLKLWPVQPAGPVPVRGEHGAAGGTRVAGAPDGAPPDGAPPDGAPPDGEGPWGERPLAPGRVWASRDAVYVGTATRPVVLGDVQPPGKRRMPAAEWARGLHRGPGGETAPLVFS